MIPNLQPYPKYKDSGVEWLGKVPEEWEVLPNRTLFQEIKDSNHPEEPLISVTISKGIIKQSDLINNTSKKDSSNEDKTKYKLVKPGDIAYNKMRAWQGAIGISDLRGIVSPAYIIQRPRRKLQNGYFHYLLRTPLFAKEAERWSYGITSDQWSLRSEHFKMIYCSIPPIEEQSAIVRYLNYTNNRIQQYITSKHKLVKLLEEQKQAIIHQAVTGAIDVTTGKPYPKYKDSGVEWLGRVPEGWEVRKLKYSLKENLKYGANESGVESMDNWPRYIRITDFDSTGKLKENNYLCLHPDIAKDFLLSDGDILFARSGATVGKTFQFKIGQHDDRKYCFAGYLIKATPNPLIVLSDYLYNFTNSLAFANWKNSIFNKATIENIGADKYALLNVLLPSTKKQRLILDYILKETEVIDKTIDRAKREIELLKEYRVRLSADVVTGKADVREVAKNLPTDVTDSIVDDPNDDYIENTEMITEVNEE